MWWGDVEGSCGVLGHIGGNGELCLSMASEGDYKSREAKLQKNVNNIVVLHNSRCHIIITFDLGFPIARHQ